MIDKAESQRQTEATSKDVGAPDGNEIEVTPEMIEAGASIYASRTLASDPWDGGREICEDVFVAMLEASDLFRCGRLRVRLYQHDG